MSRLCAALALCLTLTACDDGGAEVGAADASPPAADASPTTDAATAPAPDGAPTPDAAPPDMGAPDPMALALALARQVDRDRVETNLGFIAQPRATDTAHWQAVQDRCAAVFTEAGLEVERHAYGTGTNVLGRRTGTSRPEEVVLIGAHYDSVPNCPGADDNGTGVAGVFEAARLLGATDHARTLLLACWDEEERGLVGSRAYVRRAREQGVRFVAHFNLESIGLYDERPGSQLLPNGFEFVFRTRWPPFRPTRAAGTSSRSSARAT